MLGFWGCSVPSIGLHILPQVGQSDPASWRLLEQLRVCGAGVVTNENKMFSLKIQIRKLQIKVSARKPIFYYNLSYPIFFLTMKAQNVIYI